MCQIRNGILEDDMQCEGEQDIDRVCVFHNVILFNSTLYYISKGILFKYPSQHSSQCSRLRVATQDQNISLKVLQHEHAGAQAIQLPKVAMSWKHSEDNWDLQMQVVRPEVLVLDMEHTELTSFAKAVLWVR